MSDYVQELEAKLKATRARVKAGREIKALKAAAPGLFEIIDTEISLELNKGYSDAKPLTYDEYLESHGAVRGIRRIRNLLDSKETEEAENIETVKAIEANLKQLKDDKK